MFSDYENRFIYLRSTLKFGFWDGVNAPTNFQGPVEFTKAEVTVPKQEMEELIGNTESTAGETVASQNKVTESASFSCEFQSMTRDLFALLIGADVSALSQSTGAVADEAVTLVEGIWVKLANEYLDPEEAVTLKTAADATVDAAHYEVDYINGMIRATSATGVTGTKFSYSKAARTGEIYDAGKTKSVNLMLVGTATEKTSNRRGRILLRQLALTPSGAFDISKGGYVTGGLEGKMITPTGAASPWRFEYTDMEA